ncbi:MULTISPECIES: hypothetical protein [unclassified Pseudomonas]|uniref:hypothetical protein n=1 Tax=unclassified Pseudomonas TaxID=196821 RepID=UPI002AC89990|nr:MULTISPECIES: hypothetical protein [unclassified Pseudomonas]MEB0048512.1 hypothetical protein [Pseudomonas sp. Dout3]MEB0099375.1 hypothetical protein [Pseudomonas sp. DC1.2]WPX61700.1 hypothetical protein RHM68_11295 [Pseudomonas sp. DC1.2]
MPPLFVEGFSGLGQALVVLMTRKILEGFDVDHRDSQQAWHRQRVAMLWTTSLTDSLLGSHRAASLLNISLRGSQLQKSRAVEK